MRDRGVQVSGVRQTLLIFFVAALFAGRFRGSPLPGGNHDLSLIPLLASPKSDPISLDTGLAHNTVTKEGGYGNQIEEAPISRGRRHELRAEGASGTVERPAQDRAAGLAYRIKPAIPSGSSTALALVAKVRFRHGIKIDGVLAITICDSAMPSSNSSETSTAWIRNREGSFFTILRLCPGYTLHPTYRSSVHQEKLAARISILQ